LNCQIRVSAVLESEYNSYLANRLATADRPASKPHSDARVQTQAPSNAEPKSI
jgi:hypothetical protein